MKSYDAFKSMIDIWMQNKEELSQLIPNFEKYLSEIYGDSTTVAREVTNALFNQASENAVKLQIALENYLLNRIENGEC